MVIVVDVLLTTTFSRHSLHFTFLDLDKRISRCVEKDRLMRAVSLKCLAGTILDLMMTGCIVRGADSLEKR